ncbi:uncharacterized protein itgb3bp [Osmerus eperlanus]|uniref:uncharacterized protein itgb3bp n=1 Tax=Osmerus eperlanus TaxID=29151 RepID=UPI002E160B5F
MPVKRALRMENAETHTPVKKPATERNFSPITGTARLQLQAGNVKAGSCKPQVAKTDVENLMSLGSKMEASVPAFIKARRKLEEIVPAEGSSELKTFFSKGSANLKTELTRFKQLASKADSCLRLSGAQQNSSQAVEAGSSFEFLKSIMA